MHKTRSVDMEKNILEENERLAGENRDFFEENGIRAFNILGAIGSGKTTVIEQLSKGLEGKRIGAIAGDLRGQDDHLRFEEIGLESVAINTGKDCHLDAHYVSHGMEDLPMEELDILFIENVGNLICPVDFPLGTENEVVIVSVTEGDDMIRKHPMIFNQSDIAVINKVDLADAMEIDLDVIEEDHRDINPHGELIKMNAKKGEGIDQLAEELDLPYSSPL